MTAAPMPYMNFPDLAAAINQQSWEWLQDSEPEIADALRKEVKRGVDPDAIRRFVMHTTGRAGIAARLEQAARYLGGEGG